MNFVLQQQGKLHTTALAVAMGCGLFFSPMALGANTASAATSAAAVAQQAVQIQGTVVDSEARASYWRCRKGV